MHQLEINRAMYTSIAELVQKYKNVDIPRDRLAQELMNRFMQERKHIRKALASSVFFNKRFKIFYKALIKARATPSATNENGKEMDLTTTDRPMFVASKKRRRRRRKHKKRSEQTDSEQANVGSNNEIADMSVDESSPQTLSDSIGKKAKDKKSSKRVSFENSGEIENVEKKVEKKKKKLKKTKKSLKSSPPKEEVLMVKKRKREEGDDLEQPASKCMKTTMADVFNDILSSDSEAILSRPAENYMSSESEDEQDCGEALFKRDVEQNSSFEGGERRPKKIETDGSGKIKKHKKNKKKIDETLEESRKLTKCGEKKSDFGESTRKTTKIGEKSILCESNQNTAKNESTHRGGKGEMVEGVIEKADKLSHKKKKKLKKSKEGIANVLNDSIGKSDEKNLQPKIGGNLLEDGSYTQSSDMMSADGKFSFQTCLRDDEQSKKMKKKRGSKDKKGDAVDGSGKGGENGERCKSGLESPLANLKSEKNPREKKKKRKSTLSKALGDQTNQADLDISPHKIDANMKKSLGDQKNMLKAKTLGDQQQNAADLEISPLKVDKSLSDREKIVKSAEKDRCHQKKQVKSSKESLPMTPVSEKSPFKNKNKPKSTLSTALGDQQNTADLEISQGDKGQNLKVKQSEMDLEGSAIKMESDVEKSPRDKKKKRKRKLSDVSCEGKILKVAKPSVGPAVNGFDKTTDSMDLSRKISEAKEQPKVGDEGESGKVKTEAKELTKKQKKKKRRKSEGDQSGEKSDQKVEKGGTGRDPSSTNGASTVKKQSVELKTEKRRKSEGDGSDGTFKGQDNGDGASKVGNSMGPNSTGQSSGKQTSNMHFEETTPIDSNLNEANAQFIDRSTPGIVIIGVPVAEEDLENKQNPPGKGSVNAGDGTVPEIDSSVGQVERVAGTGEEGEEVDPAERITDGVGGRERRDEMRSPKKRTRKSIRLKSPPRIHPSPIKPTEQQQTAPAGDVEEKEKKRVEAAMSDETAAQMTPRKSARINKTKAPDVQDVCPVSKLASDLSPIKAATPSRRRSQRVGVMTKGKNANSVHDELGDLSDLPFTSEVATPLRRSRRLSDASDVSSTMGQERRRSSRLLTKQCENSVSSKTPTTTMTRTRGRYSLNLTTLKEKK